MFCSFTNLERRSPTTKFLSWHYNTFDQPAWLTMFTTANIWSVTHIHIVFTNSISVPPTLVMIQVNTFSVSSNSIPLVLFYINRFDLWCGKNTALVTYVSYNYLLFWIIIFKELYFFVFGILISYLQFSHFLLKMKITDIGI